ncbi:cell division cycle protein 123 homolog [Venturia canescens]|uniref:cell division cycle protein 123 homolog n=1 Tax=Venturia canescens TaxID=32260 RepID=UPI001C9D5ECE|nr:cell division cycle protein 123 homolog [Venturia canescens]
MVNNLKEECSIFNWYHIFAKDSLEARLVRMPNEVLEYLQHDAFILPVEASNNISVNTEWSDGLSTNVDLSEETEEEQPSFPNFSRRIQEIIDEFGAVFLKCNWRSPSDATWVAPTKTLKCTSLEEVYLLLKSSDRICGDLNAIERHTNNESRCVLPALLVLKRWKDIIPSTEFRCYVVKDKLVGICQRDASQYHQHIESEKYNIRKDITSLFNERIKGRFKLNDYSFDVIRYKKDKVKIVDFGPLDETVTKGMLFTLEELLNPTSGDDTESPEFRFIAENMGIQPTTNNHFCVPQEINEYFRLAGNASIMDVIQREVENQNET